MKLHAVAHHHLCLYQPCPMPSVQNFQTQLAKEWGNPGICLSLESTGYKTKGLLPLVVTRSCTTSCGDSALQLALRETKIFNIKLVCCRRE